MRAFLFVLLSASQAFSWEVPSRHRVPNRPPGYCAWASLETIGRCHNIGPLVGLVDARSKDPGDWLQTRFGAQFFGPHAGLEATIGPKLTKLKVKHKVQWTDDKDTVILKSANTLGVVAGFKEGAFGAFQTEPHAVVLTHIDDKRVEIYDCSRPKAMYYGSRQWFNENWTGFAVSVEP